MATLIRIKRPLASEPAESIVVKSKKQRTTDGDGEAGGESEGETTLPTSVLQRVATISCKDEDLRPDLLRAINSRRRTGEELRRTYKQPSRTSAQPTTKQQLSHQRAHLDRQKLHAQYRGDLKDLPCEGEESDKLEEKEANAKPAEGTTDNKEDAKPAKGTTDTDNKENGTRAEGREEDRIQAESKEIGKNKPEGKAEGRKIGKDKTEGKADGKTEPQIKYYDAELPWPKENDVITCNGVPLESEKFVYDLYYSPVLVDWTEFVCQVERFEYPGAGSSDETPDDDDDENDENNWRNEYPEEDDDDEPEDDDYYMSQMMHSRLKKYNTDESFDAEDYDDDDNFDEAGKLTEYGRTHVVNPLRLHFSQLTMGADDSADADGEDNDASDDDME